MKHLLLAQGLAAFGVSRSIRCEANYGVQPNIPRRLLVQ